MASPVWTTVGADGAGVATLAGGLAAAGRCGAARLAAAVAGAGGPLVADGLHLRQFLQVGVERGLLVLLELVPIRLGRIKILGGQLEIAAIEQSCPRLEILDRWHGAGFRTAVAGDGAASSGDAPSVAAPHAPKIKMTVSVLSLPNATSFRRHEDNRRHP